MPNQSKTGTTCQSCGYILAPFEPECPRCKRLGQAAAPRPPLRPPAVDHEPVRKLAGEYAAKPVPKQTDEVETDLAVGYEPPLGWPLSIILVLLAVGQAGLIVYAMAVEGNIWTAIVYAPREVATIGLLYCQRWAFRSFALFSVLPAVWFLMMGKFETEQDILTLVILVIPAILVFVMGYAKIDDLE